MNDARFSNYTADSCERTIESCILTGIVTTNVCGIWIYSPFSPIVVDVADFLEYTSLSIRALPTCIAHLSAYNATSDVGI
jgi:hypothetical protein